MELLSYNADAKTVKGFEEGWVTFIMYLAPSTVSVPFGGHDTCPWKTPGCSKACLFTAGRGRMKNVMMGRINKTLRYFNDRAGFLEQLQKDIDSAVRLAEKMGKRPCFRLNGTSDLNWSKIIHQNPSLQFYDYTASVDRVLENDIPNYHLTFSRKETTPDSDVIKILNAGKNVSVVFSQPGIKSWMGYQVVDGDKNDLRFLDPKGVIVGLKAKGDGKKDETGFVVHAKV
jgi:hypothetical protein